MKRKRRHRTEKVANDPREEGRAQCTCGSKRTAEDELQEEREEASRTRSTGDELPILDASSSVAPNADGEVDIGGPRQSTQLKRPQDVEAHTRRSTTSSSCPTEAKEIEQMLQAACKSSEEKLTRRDGGLLERRLRTAALHGVAAGGSEVIKTELG